MTDEKPKPPFDSPLVPTLLGPDDTVQFSCHKGISCFNACCRQADITLTPYDILRLKRRLGLSSTEFLARYTAPFEMDASGLPGVKLRTEDNEPVCLLVTAEGCSVYEDRPSACRYYPVGLMAMRAVGSPTDEAHYFLVKEDHCKGHDEPRRIKIADYRKEQGAEEYDDMNRDWYQIILKKRSSGPALGKPSPTSLQFFFLCSYDADRFRTFVMSDSFKNMYHLEPSAYEHLAGDDVGLMKFGFRLLKQVLFGEQTIPLKEGAVEQRIEQRNAVWEQRRQWEAERHEAEEEARRRSDDEG